jgi:hypothetical protein
MPKFIAGAVMAIFGGTAAFASVPQQVTAPRLEVQPPAIEAPLRVAPFTRTNKMKCTPAEDLIGVRPSPQGASRCA